MTERQRPSLLVPILLLAALWAAGAAIYFTFLTPTAPETGVATPEFRTRGCDPLRLGLEAGGPIPGNASWAVDYTLVNATPLNGDWPLEPGEAVQLSETGNRVGLSFPSKNYMTGC